MWIPYQFSNVNGIFTKIDAIFTKFPRIPSAYIRFGIVGRFSLENQLTSGEAYMYDS